MRHCCCCCVFASGDRSATAKPPTAAEHHACNYQRVHWVAAECGCSTRPPTPPWLQVPGAAAERGCVCNQERHQCHSHQLPIQPQLEAGCRRQVRRQSGAAARRGECAGVGLEGHGAPHISAGQGMHRVGKGQLAVSCQGCSLWGVLLQQRSGVARALWSNTQRMRLPTGPPPSTSRRTGAAGVQAAGVPVQLCGSAALRLQQGGGHAQRLSHRGVQGGRGQRLGSGGVWVATQRCREHAAVDVRHARRQARCAKCTCCPTAL